MRRRLDAELVRRGLCPSREAAQHAIGEGRVLVSGTLGAKAARLVDAAEPIELRGDPPTFVSRGGKKIEAALHEFGIDVAHQAWFDAGASTGGFTDCLLQRGAATVVAVDVGFGQLHERIRADPRVEVHERVNLRTEDARQRFAGRRFAGVCADVSFISLRSLAPSLFGVAAPGATLLLLVKPQFEAGREVVSRGRGVVRDRSVWSDALTSVTDAFVELGAAMMGAMASPITGSDGNVEFLVYLQAPGRCVQPQAESGQTADEMSRGIDGALRAQMIAGALASVAVSPEGRP